MPIYEYRCTKCQKITEKICNSSTKEIPCSECGSTTTRIVSIFSGKNESNPHTMGGCNPGSGFT